MDWTADWRVDNLTGQQLHLLVLANALTGVLYCYLGYRTLRFLVGLTGFLVAGVTAAVLAGMIWEGQPVAMGIAGLLGGICGAFAMIVLYKAGIFLLGALGGTVALHNLLASNPAVWVPVAVIAGGLVAGALALVLERPVIIVATSLLGAWMLASSAAYAFIEVDSLQDSLSFMRDYDGHLVFLAGWAVLALTGIVAQFVTTKKKEQPDES